MILDNIKPSPALAEFVSCFRIADFVFPSNEIIPPKAYPPRPQECLEFFPRDAEQHSYDNGFYFESKSKCVITGQHTLMRLRRQVDIDFLTVMVVFKPGKLFALTGAPASELVNCYEDAENFLGKEVTLINEQLYHAKSYHEMFAIVEKYLLVLINKSKKKQHVISSVAQQMLCYDDKVSIDYFIKEACICQRQFDRKFKEYIGINPKLYSRIARFDNAFRMKNRFPNKDWLTIAIHCGYYDYQHLVKEYKDLTGLTPNEFYLLDTKGPERFFGDVET